VSNTFYGDKMKKISLLLIILFILTACSTASPDIGGEWKLVSYGDAANPTPALSNVDTSIQFDSGKMSGNVGCNGFGGAYELGGDQITFSGVMSTMMYCEETSTQEQVVLAVFSDGAKLPTQLNGNTLTIASADGASVVTLMRK
jgi:heat shock protein HslJ